MSQAEIVPSISIVVCTYNNASSLQRTLLSIDNIRVPVGIPCELCIVNNNSTDDTQALCEDYVRSSRIPARWVFEGNQGLSHARNRGIREARGDFIVFTDDDVVVPENWIEGYVSTIREFGAHAVFGRITPEWNGSPPSFFCPELNPAYALLDYGPKTFLVANRAHEFYGANFGCSKRMLQDAGGFDAKLGRSGTSLFVGEERQLFLGLVDMGAVIAYQPAIAVMHVIAEKRKQKTYLRRYYTDIAVSHVRMADLHARRRLLGAPLYKVKECMSFFALLLPKLLLHGLLANGRKLFVFELQTRLYARVAGIYARRMLSRLLPTKLSEAQSSSAGP